MHEPTDVLLIIGLILTLLCSSGYWYLPSAIGQTCSARLDLLLTIPCIVTVGILASLVVSDTFEWIDEESGLSEKFRDLVGRVFALGYFLPMAPTSVYSMYSIGSCWWDFHQHPDYDYSHLAVFILYGLFALLYGIAHSKPFYDFYDTVWFAIKNALNERRTRKNIMKYLAKWAASHEAKKPSEETAGKAREALSLILRTYELDYPESVKRHVIKYHFIEEIFKVKEKKPAEKQQGHIKPGDKITTEELKYICEICSEAIFPSDKHAVLKMGPVHQNCFLSSKFLQGEIIKVVFEKGTPKIDPLVSLDDSLGAGRSDHESENTIDVDGTLEAVMNSRDWSRRKKILHVAALGTDIFKQPLISDD